MEAFPFIIQSYVAVYTIPPLMGTIAATLARALLWLFSLLPLPLNHALGGFVGVLYYYLPNTLARVTRRNIELCFPQMSAAERDALVRRNLRETARTVFETGPMWYWSHPRLLSLIKGVSGLEYVQQAKAAGKGVILAAPHLGCWEVVGHYYVTLQPMINLYRPPRIPELDPFIVRSRTRTGSRLATTSAGGVKELMQALKKGECAGILPDQDPGRGGAGVFAPFFGIDANTMTLLPRLVQRTGAMVIFAFAERLPGGQGYHVHFLPGDPAIGDVDFLVGASALNAGVERCVRQLPHQYQWGYKRFRSRPPGEKKLY